MEIAFPGDQPKQDSALKVIHTTIDNEMDKSYYLLKNYSDAVSSCNNVLTLVWQPQLLSACEKSMLVLAQTGAVTISQYEEFHENISRPFTEKVIQLLDQIQVRSHQTWSNGFCQVDLVYILASLESDWTRTSGKSENCWGVACQHNRWYGQPRNRSDKCRILTLQSSQRPSNGSSSRC